MPNDSNRVFVDVSFLSPSEATKETEVEVRLATPDNIGSYSTPVIYTKKRSQSGSINTWLEYFHEITTQSGVEDVAGEYFSSISPLNDGVIPALVEFTFKEVSTFNDDLDVIYSSGFNVISGSVNKDVDFVAGKKYEAMDNIATDYYRALAISGTLYWWTNYTNFSGNLTISGTPIPFYDTTYSFTTEYGALYTQTSGFLNNFVDISFAGWVDYPVTADIYSALLGYAEGYPLDITAISGSVDVHYLDLFSSVPTISGIGTEVYCSLTDYIDLDSEIETRDGRINYERADIYSTALQRTALVLDVDLFSIKISNFSLEEGEFTTASGFISVDVTDDECPVSTSGTYFMVDGVQVPVSLTSITDGYRVYYDPADDFSSIEGPTTFTVHAENECGDILEKDFYLTFGYVVEYKNQPVGGLDYGYGNKIAVRVTAENYASCPQVGSLAWDFESAGLKNRDLGASIVGRFHAVSEDNLSAKIYPQSTAYFYGKEFRVVVKAKDFAGNEMEPLILSYRIEDKP